VGNYLAGTNKFLIVHEVINKSEELLEKIKRSLLHIKLRRNPMGNLEVDENKNLNQKHNFSLLSYLISMFVAIFLYVFFEWLFIVTKPSFMSTITLKEKIFIIFYSFSFLSLLSLIIIIPLNYVKIHIKNKILEFAINFLVIGLTSFLLSSITLMLTDNFTYTLFKQGIITSEKFVKVIYLVFFISLIILFSGKIIKFYLYIDSKISKNFFHKIIWVISILVTIIALINPVKFIASKRNITQLNFAKIDTTNDLPNIFLFTCESCDADHFSLYGYKRKTTPFLEKISDHSLVSMNAFSNAQGTTGSTTSILTGKYPTDTRVIYAPDILHGNDAYQHLPGILKIHGYYSAQLSFNWYADAYDLNFKNGFSEANGRSNETNDFLTLIISIDLSTKFRIANS